MSGNVTVLLARRSIRARIGRLIAIAVAIVIGVSFVVGSFVLADSLRGGFDSLFTDINSHTDLEVRTKLAFGDTNDGSTRDPMPASLVDTVQSVPGVGTVDPGIQRQAVIIGPDGEAVGSGGAPSFGISWDGDTSDSPIVIREGKARAATPRPSSTRPPPTRRTSPSVTRSRSSPPPACTRSRSSA